MHFLSMVSYCERSLSGIITRQCKVNKMGDEELFYFNLSDAGWKCRESNLFLMQTNSCFEVTLMKIHVFLPMPLKMLWFSYVTTFR